MMKYEMKKVFSKKGSSIALLLLLTVFIITCGAAVNIDYVNEMGITESGYSAVRKLRLEKEQWKGILNTELIGKVIEENRRIAQTPEAASKDDRQNNIAYSWKQGFCGIRDLLNVSFASGFREYDYYKADSLAPEQAENFYDNRTRLLKTWLEGEAKEQYSEKEKNYLIRQYETIATPFHYDYMEGWVRLFEYSPTIIMITILILGYLTAGIFSKEFQWRTDSIFFSSYYGRNRAIKAKLKAGIFIATMIYWIVFLAYSLFVLLYMGAGGADCRIQADWSNWKSFYQLTNLQAYFLIAAAGYLGCIFIVSVIMLVSAKTKSTVIAVLVPFMLIFIPSFLSGFQAPIVGKIIGLLPDQFLQISSALGMFNIYSIFGIITGAVPLLFVLYSVLLLLILPLTYSAYRSR